MLRIKMLKSLVFGLPFCLLPQLRTDRSTKFGIAGTFFLGAFTISICTFRFVWGFYIYVYPTTVILLCTAEFTTALIVVCLPMLRPLILTKRGSKKEPVIKANKRRIEDALEKYSAAPVVNEFTVTVSGSSVDDNSRELS
jgi:hypothetical protein